MADESRIAELIFKQLRQGLSVEEKEELDTWINASDVNRQFMETRMRPDTIQSGLQALLDKDEAAIRQKSDKLCPEAAVPEVGAARLRVLARTIAAAVVVGMIVTGGIIFFRHQRVASVRPAQFAQEKLQQMTKVTDRAKLTLSGGTTIFLDNLSRGDSVDADGWRVSKVDSNHIIYSGVTGKISKNPGVNYHTFSTPYGQRWQLSLPDHSQIQLSTGTSLAYPVMEASAKANKRNLVLQGEAQFEVKAAAGEPFVVFTRNANVTALSTIFDVRDYSDKEGFLASVVRGAINVSNGETNLKVGTGEAARMDSSLAGIKMVTDYDTARGLSWRTEFFDLTGMNVRQSMEELRRWYGMEAVIIHPGVDTVTRGLLSTGTVKKAAQLVNLLPLLEKQHLHLTIEGKNIVARP